jgi:hypothetical protein
MTKRFLSAVALALLLLAGDSPAYAEAGNDIVVLFDVSESVLPIFGDLQAYLIDTVLRRHVRYGDTFHLISFAANPETEISRVIEAEDDIEPIVARILLIQPLGRYTDLISAFNYLYQYVFDLPVTTKKMIIILSDGVHAPPPTSPFYGIEDPESQMRAIAGSIREQGWDVFLIGLPANGRGAETPIAQGQAQEPSAVSGSGTGSGGAVGYGSVAGSVDRAAGSPSGASLVESAVQEEALLSGISDALGVDLHRYPADMEHINALGFPTVLFPEYLGKVKRQFSFPLVFSNPTDSRMMLKIGSILYNQENILDAPQSVVLNPGGSQTVDMPITLPQSVKPGIHDLEFTIGFTGQSAAYPNRGVVSFELAAGRVWEVRRFLTYVLIGVSALLVLGGVIYFVLHLRGVLEGTAARTARAFHEAEPERAPATAEAAVTAQQPPLKARHPEPSAPSSAHVPVGKRPAEQIPISALIRHGQDGLPGSAPLSTDSIRAIAAERGIDIEMIVSGQNPFSGHRNIETFRSGVRKQVGAKGSAYAIIILHVQDQIGEISFDGERFVFSVLRKEFFPDSPEKIENCLNQDILVRDKDGRKTTIFFRVWENPVDRFNRIMHLIDAPGLPSWIQRD